MNPVILADNRFLDGTPTATDTEPGYDVLNIRDLKEFTFWKAASPGTKYLTVNCDAAIGADSIGIYKHNLGSALAAISVESSSNGTDWTERLAQFSPSDDKAILRTFTGVLAQYWRVKIVAVGISPQVAILLLGERITFPFPPETPYSPLVSMVEAEAPRSKEGIPLGAIVRFKPYTIRPRWNHVARAFVETYFLPFWNDYASNLSPFFWAWDLDVFPNDVRFPSVPADHNLETPVSVLAYYDSIALPMEGTKE
jgi:hypothetical protein